MTQVLPQGINTIFSNYLKFIYNTTTKSKFAVSPPRFDSITGNNMATPSGSSSSKRRVKGPGGPHGYGKYIVFVLVYEWFFRVYDLI